MPERWSADQPYEQGYSLVNKMATGLSRHTE